MAADDRLARWRAGFEDMFALVAGRFAQADSRHRARMSLLGLLAGAERKNSWTIAEQAGVQAPGRHAVPAELLPLGLSGHADALNS
jgi:SRSO17 transposase